MMLKECNKVGKRDGLRPMELLGAVILTANEWTPENGLLTAAQRVRRGKLARYFERELKVCVSSWRFRRLIWA